MSEDEMQAVEERESKKRLFLAGGQRSMREKLEGKAFLIPSFITVIGIFCGFLGLMAAIRGEFYYATKCIAMAFLLDGVDGRVARRLNATSAFGREFDSLADVIAFGVAPAVLVYTWGFQATADEFGLLVAYIFVVCGATRLARFNITTSSEVKHHFEGLPIPGAAAAIISLIYFHPTALEGFFSVTFMLMLTLVLAGLMVSRLPFMSVKHLKLTQGNPRLNLLLLAAAVALVWYHAKIALVLIANGYALSGPVIALVKKKFPERYAAFRKSVM